jgi:hypothetical protein
MISFGCIDVGGMQFIFYELKENSPDGRKWEATLAKGSCTQRSLAPGEI